MTNNIKKNLLYNTCYQVFKFVIPLLTIPYLSRILGPEKIGIYSYQHSIVAYFSLLAESGTFYYAQREIAYHRNDARRISRIFKEVFLLRFIISSVLIIIYSIYVLFISEEKFISFVLGASIINVILDVSWFFQGLEIFDKIVKRNVLIKILNLVFVFGFVNQQEDLKVYVIGTTIINMLGALSLWVGLSKHIIKIALCEIHPFSNIFEIFYLAIPTVCSQIYLYLDRTMLGILSDSSAEVGYYEQSQSIVRVMIAVITSLGLVMAPRIANTYKENNREKIKYYMSFSYRFIWALSIPISVGMCAIASSFVPWFLGADYEKCVGIISIFSFYLIFNGITNITGIQFLIQVKKQNIVTISMIVGTLTNIILNIVLIPRFSSYGVALASVFAEMVMAIIEICYSTIVLKLFSLKDVFKTAKNYCISGTIMFVFVQKINSIITWNNIFETMILIAVGIVSYFFALMVLRDDLFVQIKYIK